MIDIETWTRPVDNPEDSYVYPMDKAVILNIKKYIPESFEKAMKKDPEMLEKLKTFAIERTAFQNKTKDICNYVDYFIEQYDEDKELPLAYLSLKQIIDDEKYQLTAQEFQKLLYKRLFSPRLKKAIYRLVHDNYHIDVTVDAKSGRIYDDPDDFTNEDAKRFLAISMMMKIAIPPVEHFISVYKQYWVITVQDLIVDMFTEIFYSIGNVTDSELILYGTMKDVGTVDVIDYENRENHNDIDIEDLIEMEEQAADDLMKKLYKFVNGRLRKHSKNNQLLWSQQSALRGVTEDAHRDRLLSK